MAKPATSYDHMRDATVGSDAWANIAIDYVSPGTAPTTSTGTISITTDYQVSRLEKRVEALEQHVLTLVELLEKRTDG